MSIIQMKISRNVLCCVCWQMFLPKFVKFLYLFIFFLRHFFKDIKFEVRLKKLFNKLFIIFSNFPSSQIFQTAGHSTSHALVIMKKFILQVEKFLTKSSFQQRADFRTHSSCGSENNF